MGRRTFTTILVLLVLAAACASPSAPPSETLSPSASPLAVEGVPAGEPVRIDWVGLSADRQTVMLTFAGAAAYSPLNPCSAQYAGWARPAGDVLQVAVVEVIGIQPSPGTDCPFLGYVTTIKVLLAAPFAGSTAVDVGTGPQLTIELLSE